MVREWPRWCLLLGAPRPTQPEEWWQPWCVERALSSSGAAQRGSNVGSAAWLVGRRRAVGWARARADLEEEHRRARGLGPEVVRITLVAEVGGGSVTVGRGGGTGLLSPPLDRTWCVPFLGDLARAAGGPPAAWGSALGAVASERPGEASEPETSCSVALWGRSSGTDTSR
ncbi:hypothetical protein NDU88_005797 [Pleurodeles waltl]|uniref:Uncharacterized protein n=1 Tax=Pleurodeles waltl TaxID=8319 RepID=A0AAV7TBL5_PLEWA|nr:hypothetical protein NDU88_005797 [Pleurodeles waltl]